MAANVVESIRKAIGIGDVNNFIALMNLLPWQRSAVETQDRYLLAFMGMAAKQPNPDIHVAIYQKWIDLNPDEEGNPILPKIIYLGEAEILKKFLEAIRMNYYSAIILISHYFDESMVHEVLYKTDSIFGLQPHNIYLQLMDYLKPRDKVRVMGDPQRSLNELASALVDPESGEKMMSEGGIISQTQFCDVVFTYLKEKIEQTAPSVGKPKWILPTMLTNYIEDPNEDVMVLLPDPGDAADMIVNHMNAMIKGDRSAEARVVLEESYRSSPGVTVKLNLLLPIYTDIFIKPYDNDECIRCYGPLNPFITVGETLFAINSRMLECTRYDVGKIYEVEDDYGYEDTTTWFTGNCQICGNTIDRLHWALRMPMPAGGWKGCYCSWSCVIEDLPKNLGGIEKNLNERQIIGHLIRYFYNLITRVGIYDRKEIQEEEEIEQKIEVSETMKTLAMEAGELPIMEVDFDAF